MAFWTLTGEPVTVTQLRGQYAAFIDGYAEHYGVEAQDVPTFEAWLEVELQDQLVERLAYLLNQDGEKGWVELTQHDDHVTYPTRDGGIDRAPCMWFLNCTRKAVTTVPTGERLLGDVPACRSCADFANGVR